MELTRSQKGSLLMLISTVFASAMYLISDYVFMIFPELTSGNAMFWGSLGSVLVSAPYYFGSGKARRNLRQCVRDEWKVLLLVSTFTTLGGFIWWYTIEQTSSGLVALLGKSEPLFAVILGVLFLGERISAREGMAMLIAASGFVLVSTLEGEITTFLVLLILFSRVLYTLQSLVVKRWSPGIDGYSFAFLRLILMTLWAGIAFGSLGWIQLIPFPVMVSITFALFLNAIVAKMLYFEAHKYLPISKLNFFLLLQTVFVLGGASYFFGDPLSAKKVIGALLVFAGMILFYLLQSRVKVKRHAEVEEGKL